MIKVDYLSEVEALWVQRQAVVQSPIQDRVIAVWAIVGKDVHGFTAVVDRVDGGVVHFTPVCDIVSLISRETTWPGGTHGFIDYSKRDGHTLVAFFVSEAKRRNFTVDEDLLTGYQPTI